jgi:uncharacterized membrane protein YpjA
MRAVARELGFAFLAWLVPFAVSVCLFPLKKSHPPLFEAFMGVTLVASTVALGCVYLRRPAGNPLMVGTRIGLIWMGANWLLDSLMFSGGPMKMSLAQYATEIAPAYLMIPVITIGLGHAAKASLRLRESTAIRGFG